MTQIPRFIRTLPPTASTRDITDSVNQIIKLDNLTAQVLPVELFGARGDGTTDDSAAITAAFSYLRSLGSSASATFISFPRTYLVTTTINATSIRNLTWGVVGPGTVTGQTNGTPIFDFSDSRYCVMRDITIIGSTTNPPNVGVLLAIISGGDVSDEHTFENVSISGRFTVASYYNYGSEDFNGSDLICRNDYNNAAGYCAVFTGYNSMGVTSPYKTLATSTATSFNDVYLIHGDFRKTNTGTPIYVERSSGLQLLSGYAVSYDSAAIVVNDPDGAGNVALELDVHCETSGLTTCVRFDSAGATATVNGFKFRDYYPEASSEIFSTKANVAVTIKDLDITIDAFGVSPTNHIWHPAAGGSFSLLGGEIRIPDTTHLNTVGAGIRYIFSNGTIADYGVIGINQASPTGALEIASSAAQYATNANVSRQLRLTKLTSGTPAAGIGVGLEAIIQTAASNYELGGAIDISATDVTSATEDFDWVFSLMKAGAAPAEMFRLKSTGQAKLKTFTVATLPTGAAGDISFATDGRKNGEGGGAGTGVLVFHDGTAWRACDTGATVAA